ncbi:MAG: hypothetical protein D6748_08630 [Calditrichaeota bacterium]|nr:MAG: hypothetical protein D6748_08630 [Calditrichota bacterium]
MLIKSPDNSDTWKRKYFLLSSSNKRKVLLFIFYTLIIFSFGTFSHSHEFVKNTVYPLIADNLQYLSHFYKGLFAKTEHLTIDIKHKHFLKLAYKREQALKNGILLKSPDDYVPAKIRYGDKTYRVKLRLKGDLSDHWRGDKWSLRIILKGKNTLWGMKRFSIQDPGTRGYIYEWLYHRIMRMEGIIALRYNFINVTINGKEKGLYALEEHFGKRLIEHNRLREGPIIRFNESFAWAELATQDHLNVWERKLRSGSGSYFSSNIDGFQSTRWSQDSTLNKIYLKALYLLEAFRRGEKTTSEVFDIPKLAKFFALSDLLGATHGVANWTNVRFYYNPITSRLEPIAFDGYDRTIEPIQSTLSTIALNSDLNTTNDYYLQTFFQDTAFYQAYLKELYRVSRVSYLDSILTALNDEIQSQLAILYREYPEFNFSSKFFYNNQKIIRSIIHPVKTINAYLKNIDSNSLTIEVANIQSLPVYLHYISDGNKLFFPLERNLYLKGKPLLSPLQFKEVTFLIPENFHSLKDSLTLSYSFLRDGNIYQEKIYPHPSYINNLVTNDAIHDSPNVSHFSFLLVDEKTKTIWIKPGVWEISEDLIIPKGYIVEATENTILNLKNSSSIISYSPLHWVGSRENPIIIESVEKSAQGMIVLNTHSPNHLEHVIFKNLSAPHKRNWELSGAVTFYESPTNLINVQIINPHSEDGLNIVRSDFTIENTLFKNTLSDAFDADFTSGTIKNSFFIDCGNDAIDVSGSIVSLENINIINAGDKGLSAGEKSMVTAKKIIIKDSEIALASKDLSELIVKDVKIVNCKVGYTAFQKKPEFGPASIKGVKISLDNTQVPHLLELGSNVVINGNTLKATQKNVENILYGVQYGKSSK